MIMPSFLRCIYNLVVWNVCYFPSFSGHVLTPGYCSILYCLEETVKFNNSNQKSPYIINGYQWAIFNALTLGIDQGISAPPFQMTGGSSHFPSHVSKRDKERNEDLLTRVIFTIYDSWHDPPQPNTIYIIIYLVINYFIFIYIYIIISIYIYLFIIIYIYILLFYI